MKSQQQVINTIKWKIENLEAIASGRKAGASLNDLQLQIRSLWELTNMAFDKEEVTPNGYDLLVALRDLNDWVDGNMQFSLRLIQEVIEECKKMSENQLVK